MPVDDDLDRLYQLPLSEFTAARNELAKRAGSRAGEVRRLPKPPISAWAVNQLYWQDRRTYDALVESAEALRTAHTAVLSGKRGDLRFAGKEHEEALEQAVKRTLALLADGGHPVTDSTRNAVAQTLRALPADDPPGRLTRALTPGGFEMLSGITIKRGAKPSRASREAPTSSGTKPTAKRDDDRQRTQAAEEATAAARALREAEHSVRRAEFEAARSGRAAARADEALADARASLDAAKKRLEEADAEAAASTQKKRAAEQELARTTHQLAAARERANAAATTLKKYSP